jgi:hypothetical protein
VSLAAALFCPAQDAPRAAGWVVIPVQEYSALRGKAFPIETPPVEPPLEATLTRVEYDLRVKDSVATGHAVLTVDVLKDGWVKVPIPAGLLVGEARLEGKPVTLVQGAAVLDRRGRSVLSLDLALAVNTSGGEEKIILPASSSGVTRVSLAVGRPDVEVKVAGGFLAEQPESGWLAYGTGSEPLVFSWKRKIVEQPREELPLRMRGSLVEMVALGEDSTSISAEVNLEVVQGAARQVKIVVPEGLAINQVPGATVADWDVRDGRLTVTFLDGVQKSARFVIQGETRLAREGALTIPLLRLEDVERETGGVAVEVLGAGEIKQWKPQGLEAAEAADLGPAAAARQAPLLAAFRLRPGAPARALSLDVVRYAQKAVLTANIEEARYRVLVSGEGKTLVQARYAVRNNQRNFVKIALPPGAVLWSSSLAGRPVRPGQGADGSLLFPLSKARAGEEAPVFAIEILYLARGNAWNDRARASVVLPALDLPISRTGVLLYYPPLYRVTAESGAFRAQEYAQPQSPILTASALPPPAQPGVPPALTTDAALANTQVLVDRYRESNLSRTPAASLPLRVTFPTVGPSMFLVSELTGEGQAPRIELSYQKDKRGGVQ